MMSKMVNNELGVEVLNKMYETVIQANETFRKTAIEIGSNINEDNEDVLVSMFSEVNGMVKIISAVTGQSLDEVYKSL